MLLNGIDINNYGATLLDKDIQTAEVITYQDWLRNAPNFIVTGQKETYKVIVCELMVKGTDDDDILEKISDFIKQAEKCTIRFDDTAFIYDAILKNKSHKRLGNSHKIYALHIEWQSGYAYLPDITETMNNVASKTITVPGNLPTAAVVTIMPTIDTISATLTGLGKSPIIVNNLHANIPVVIDGEKCTVTEADIDTTLTVAAGLNKWNFRKYNMVSFTNSDGADLIAPLKSSIPVDSSYSQNLIPDGALLAKNLGYDYLGHLKTSVFATSPKTVNINFCHDDGASIYLNDEVVYSLNWYRDENNGPASASLDLAAGWNTLEIIWIQHYGPDGIWGITPTIGSQVEGLNCYYSRDADAPGTVNKFTDTDLWSFPSLQPGSNVLGITPAIASVQVTYKPKFI